MAICFKCFSFGSPNRRWRFRFLDLLDHIPADPRGRERAVDADRAGADLDDGPVG